MDPVEQRWRALTGQAAHQYGLLTRHQILSQLTKGELETRVRKGVLERAQKGVWRIAGSQQTWRQRAEAALLSVAPPAAISHYSAARLWELEAGSDHRLIHLSVPHERNGRSRSGVSIHRSRLLPHEITAVHGIMATSAARTIADLAPLLPIKVLATCVDEAMRRRLIHPAELPALQTSRYRQAGASNLNLVANQRTEPPGESVWEDRVFWWLVNAGLPRPVRQHPLHLAGTLVRLDLAYPEQLVGIEFDGWEWHRGRTRFDRDRWRASELALAGWTIIWVTSAQTSTEVVERVRRALGAARSRPGPPEQDTP